MAALLVWQDHTHPPQRHKLFKNLTTMGSDPAADIALQDPKIEDFAAHISLRNNIFTITSVGTRTKIYVQGQRVYSRELKGGEEIRIGEQVMLFELNHRPDKAMLDYNVNRELQSYQRLLAFSRRLANEHDINGLLNAVLEEVIQLVKAEKGFLVLLNDQVPSVIVARHFGSSSAPETIEELSDSILRKVISSREPVVVSDAAHDREFSASASVINFRLSSVMCVPLLSQGKLLGAIYVANNSLTNVFDRPSLDILSVFAGQASLILQSTINTDKLFKQTQELSVNLSQAAFVGMIGSCPSMVKLFGEIELVAHTDVNVFISGESGTGKRLLAREIHKRSLQCKKPLVEVNCVATSPELLELELFGCVRGASALVTGSRHGKLQQANGGIILLEEVGALPLSLQIKLLSACQEGCFSRVGDAEQIEFNARIIATDYRNIRNMVKNYIFHEGFFTIIATFELDLPPLAERGNDVLVMANYYINKNALLYDKQLAGLSEDGQNAILNYSWPGNIRQLENKVRRAVIMATGSHVSAADLGMDGSECEVVTPLSTAVEQFRQKYIQEALERNAGNRTKAAHELKVDPRTIFRYLEGEKKGVRM